MLDIIPRPYEINIVENSGMPIQYESIRYHAGNATAEHPAEITATFKERSFRENKIVTDAPFLVHLLNAQKTP